MSDDPFGLKPMREGEKQLHDEAERIYLGWTNKKFSIDTEKAVKTPMTVTSWRYEKNFLRQEVRRRYSENMTLADMFSNAITDYGKWRGHPYDWSGVAADLKRAYTALETYGCLIDSPEEQIRKLKVAQEETEKKLVEANKRADKFEKRFKKTYDALIDVHNRLSEMQKDHSDILGKDIKNYLDSNTSGVLQGKFGEDDEDGDDKK